MVAMSDSPKTLVLIHGRGFKPAATDLLTLWRDALRLGIQRDAPDQVAAFDAVDTRMVYYGDLSGAVLAAAGRHYDAALDLNDLRHCLEALAAHRRSKAFRRENYERLPGKSPLKEFLADVSGAALRLPGIGARLLDTVAPELADYWHPENSHLREADHRVQTLLRPLLAQQRDILLVTHCLGGVLAFNALHATSTHPPEGGRINAWLTLGTPLADNLVRSRLAGAREQGLARYPTNVLSWINLSAEDDYICHDKNVADDYRDMLNARLVSRIEDRTMYNLAVRYGRSNPHCVLGYLVHPRTVQVLAGWLQSTKT